MALSTYKLNESDLKNPYSEILIEVYYLKDLYKIISFCKSHGYKLLFCYHKPEKTDDDEKQLQHHIHCLIKSDRKHRFNVKSLCNNETLHCYNFYKCKTTNIAFINYVMHNDYDYKIKYHFEEVHFINVSKQSIRDYKLEILHQDKKDKEICDTDLFNIPRFEKLLFENYFNNFDEIKSFCSRTQELRRYFIFHCKQIEYAYKDLCGKFYVPP